MSAMDEGASAPAAKDAAGLDLDDELKQLLKEQEDFLKQSKRPAAKVTRLGGRPAAKQASNEDKKSAEGGDDEDAAVAAGPQILGSVVERDIIDLNIQNVNVMPRSQATGFPAVQRRGESLFGKRQRQPLSGAASATISKPSRFSAMKKQHEQQHAHIGIKDRDDDVAPLDPERQEIDRTNTARLQEMSLDEIRQAQQELLASLDPKLVEKLMSKKKTSNTTTASKTKAPLAAKPSSITRGGGTGAGVSVGKTIVNHEEEDDDREERVVVNPSPAAPISPAIDLAKIQSEDELHEQAKLLPPEERAKHEWMQSVPATDASVSASKTKSNATAKKRKAKLQATTERFDFNGECISALDDHQQQPAHSGLFHHGDEPDAAGYTMAELLHLARSTVASQRAMALTTITKILRKRAKCVETQSDLSKVFPRVLPNDLPITMRIGLDDQNYTALSAAIGALHAFLVPNSSSQASSDSNFEGAYGAVVTPPRIHLHQNIKDEQEQRHEGALTAATMTPSTATHLAFETPQTEEVVYIDTSESEEDSSAISDEELTFLDPVQGFLNMDIGTRLRYILESIQLPDQSATEMMLDILIQIANHSPKAAKDIGTNAKLMKAIQRKFIENEDVLTLQEENETALRLTVKALVLVRALCQGSRATAAFLIGNGVIQSTKGFLAIQGSGRSSSSLYFEIQRESLRIWRVLLNYGLDFHCFAYLFPILCGFRGADLVRPTAEEKKNDEAAGNGHAVSTSGRPASVTGALFAALEAFCGLETVHEAQHYFNQLGFFMSQARDEILMRMKSAGGEDANATALATALRFLSATASLVQKFHLDSSILTQVFQALHQTKSWGSWNAEVLSAAVRFHAQVIANGLLSDDLDEDEATTQFLQLVKPHLQQSIAKSLDTQTAVKLSIHEVSLVCGLLTAAGDLIVRTKDLYDDVFVATMYAFGLTLMEKFVSGLEYWLSELLVKLLFQPVVLQRIGFFNGMDASVMSRVLIPIYQALVNTSPEQEAHSRRNFEAKCSSPGDKTSCQLRVPQYEDEYVGSNLPLPGFWMFCPFSRMEFASQVGDAKQKKPTSGPTRAESDEMKLIVSATCRYLYQLETATTKQSLASSASAWKNVSVTYQSEMRAEDKLFHLLHVFFAGGEVLFDEHVDMALRQFLPNFAVSVLTSKSSPTLLYDGILRNLRRFQHLDPNFNASASADVSFSTDEQLVMTFVEKLVADFTSLSYGNVHFARCVTLLVASDFPIALRKWVWKELQDCRLLHVLQPFDDQAAHATFVRCTTGIGGEVKKIHDEQLLQLMKQALCQQQISLEKGAFAYKIAVHHVTVYLFGDAKMSFSRQLLAQDLVTDALPQVWRHLLSYDFAAANDSDTWAFASKQTINSERVERMETLAGLSSDQIAAFHAKIAE
ncbi:Rna polymerase ii-associated protein 1 [Globisporangium polare]